MILYSFMTLVFSDNIIYYLVIFLDFFYYDLVRSIFILFLFDTNEE